MIVAREEGVRHCWCSCEEARADLSSRCEYSSEASTAGDLSRVLRTCVPVPFADSTWFSHTVDRAIMAKPHMKIVRSADGSQLFRVVESVGWGAGTANFDQ